jgi:CRP/FNR family transcriptional regulator, cyclic AMP receptor protein
MSMSISGGRDLGHVGLLKGLGPVELEAAARVCQWRDFSAGQQVFDQDSDNRDIYFVASGRVRVTFYAHDGHEIAFRDLNEGACFGELSAIDGKARSASVVALTPCTLAILTRKALWALVRAYPDVAENLLRHLAGLVRSLSERVVDFSTLGVQNRIQAELLRMAREAGIANGQALITPLPRHADIASRVSTNREAVARELSRLAKLGIVERHSDALAVRDMNQLIEMVDKVRAE